MRDNHKKMYGNWRKGVKMFEVSDGDRFVAIII